MILLSPVSITVENGWQSTSARQAVLVVTVQESPFPLTSVQAWVVTHGSKSICLMVFTLHAPVHVKAVTAAIAFVIASLFAAFCASLWIFERLSFAASGHVPPPNPVPVSMFCPHDIGLFFV